MNYAYNLIEVKCKNDICFCPQDINDPKTDLRPYFVDTCQLSAIKFARDTEGEPFNQTTIANRCLKLHIQEVERGDLVNKENKVVVISGVLEKLNPFTDIECLRLDDNGFGDFEKETYVSIAYDVERRVGILYRANFLDEEAQADGEGIPIMLGEDLKCSPDVDCLEQLKQVGIPKSILESQGLVANLEFLT